MAIVCRLAFVFLFVIFLFTLLLSTTVSAISIENPKAIDYIKVRITESGTLVPSDNVEDIKLRLYIPQDYIDISANAEEWGFTNDTDGNTIIEMRWSSLSTVTEYSITATVESHSKDLREISPVLTNETKYLVETDAIQFTEWTRDKAYPYVQTVQKASEMTLFVHDFIDYDRSFVSRKLSTSEIIEQRKGVCVEYSTLLAALLRASGIPTKFVAGYAYSVLDNRFIGHTWNEIPTENGWVSLDPTWLEAGYLDATHIKTGDFVDNKQIETIEYLGPGSIEWTRNQPLVEILNASEKAVNVIELSFPAFYAGKNGYLKATLSGMCNIADITFNSCVDNTMRPLFSIYEKERRFFYCGSKEVYWLFDIESENYRCPVSVYEQSGTEANATLEIKEKKATENVFINGPDTVNAGESFMLEAQTTEDSFLFYSPTFGTHPNKEWLHNIMKAGTYEFYLYSKGSLDRKTIQVLKEAEFSIVLSHPQNVTIKEWFEVNLTVKNLRNKTTDANISVETGDIVLKGNIDLAANEEKTVSFNLTDMELGTRRIVGIAQHNAIATITSTIDILEKKANAVEEFMNVISSAINKIIDAIEFVLDTIIEIISEPF